MTRTVELSHLGETIFTIVLLIYSLDKSSVVFYSVSGLMLFDCRLPKNAGYHHVLDWRLGVDLIKLMLDNSYDMGYTDLDSTPYGDLREQMRIAGETVTRNNSLIELKTEPNGHYYLSTIKRIPPAFETKETIVHPLWNHNPMECQNVFELLRTGQFFFEDHIHVTHDKVTLLPSSAAI